MVSLLQNDGPVEYAVAATKVNTTSEEFPLLWSKVPNVACNQFALGEGNDCFLKEMLEDETKNKWGRKPILSYAFSTLV